MSFWYDVCLRRNRSEGLEGKGLTERLLSDSGTHAGAALAGV